VGISGVNVAGYLRTESGVGAAARGYVRALRQAGLALALNDVSHLCGNRHEDASLSDFTESHPFDTNLVCVDIEKHYGVVATFGDEFFANRYNIAAWHWELPRFPAKWKDVFGYYDEIWVPSTFVANALSSVSPIPVVRVPPVLTPARTGSRPAGRARLGIGPHEFLFLFVFDFNSTFARKNPLAVIDAFKLAFQPHEAVRLVLKYVNGDVNPSALALLQECARGSGIDLHGGYWPAQEIADLMAAADAYVSLHRSEGIGLTITDAMALGKPVIATGWSGNMDLMSVANSFPVRYGLVPNPENAGPYKQGEIWAEPSVEHAAELLRAVFADRAAAAARAARAQDDIERDYSVQSVASLIRRHLDAAESRRRPPAERSSVNSHFSRYRELISRVRATVETVLRSGTTLLVISKGDEELLRFNGRRALHFPQVHGGRYAGYYPRDGADAIAHLRELCAKGVDALLIPGTAFWWLDHYVELKEYLARHSRLLHADDACMIFQFDDTTDRPTAAAGCRDS
jgi:glycosyltransferase involved in cell wall biosynthesis